MNQTNKKHLFSVDRYKVIRLIGKGEEGSVYLAEYKDKKQNISICVLKVSVLERLENEFFLMGQLHIDGIRYFCLSEYHYLCIPYLGTSLIGSILPKNDFHSCVIQLIHQLHRLHRIGYSHNDIKPDNILLDNNGLYHLIDYGCCLKLKSIKKQKLWSGNIKYASIRQCSNAETFVSANDDFESLLYVLLEAFYQQNVSETKTFITSSQEKKRFWDQISETHIHVWNGYVYLQRVNFDLDEFIQSLQQN